MNARRILLVILMATVVCLVSAGVGGADEVNVTFESHFDGATEAVAVSGDYVYIGQGLDFVVLDITNPAAPSELSKLNTAVFAQDIAVSGDYAYIADEWNGLVILRTSPIPPTLTINSLANGTTVNTSTITVTGTSTDNSGIANVTVNGILTTADAAIVLEIAAGSCMCTGVSASTAGMVTGKHGSKTLLRLSDLK